jgi:hypothetical protein
VSLDAREERTLNSIADNLTAAAPELASRLSVFNRLASGEQMPEHLAVKAEGRRGRHDARTGGKRRPLMRASGEGMWPVFPVVAVMAVTTVIMIAVGVVLSTTSHPPARTHPVVQCARTWPVQCPRR